MEVDEEDKDKDTDKDRVLPKNIFFLISFWMELISLTAVKLEECGFVCFCIQTAGWMYLCRSLDQKVHVVC